MVSEIVGNNSVEHVVSEVGSHLLDYSERFAKGFLDGGLERPINGIAQVASLGHLPELDLVQLDSNATGAEKWAEDIGSAAGQIFDFVILSKLVGSAASSLGAPEAALSTRLGTSAMTGFLSGSVLTPLKPGENQWDRLGNGASQAASFMAMDGISSALVSKIAAPTLLNSITRGGISGAGAGVVFANMDSLTHGKGLASGSEMLSEGASWGTGGALMGGLGYGFSKIFSKDTAEATPKSEVRPGVAYTAEGEQANISIRQLGSGKTLIDSVDLPNGTRMVREGLNKWSTNPDTPQHQVWKGDIRLSDSGKLQYVYQFAKAPDVVTVDVRLPDGSRLAMPGADGNIVLPGSSVDVANQTLADAALTSLRKLNVDIPADRLKIEGITASDSVSTNYSVQLTPEEAVALRQKISTAGATIVSESTVVALPKSVVHEIPVGENVPGEYVYDRPMADHTATTAYVYEGDDGRLKVLIGVRKLAPEQGKDALPGGFLDIKGNAVESPVDAAVRETLEETGLKLTDPTVVRIADTFGRDTRGRGIDTQFVQFGNKEEIAHLLEPSPTENPELRDLLRLQERDVLELLGDPNSLAFDHHRALLAAYQHIVGSKVAPLGMPSIRE
ncbi:hypothetical protein BH10CYA1_BH10CYA1_23890 [soil metagenome]